MAAIQPPYGIPGFGTGANEPSLPLLSVSRANDVVAVAQVSREFGAQATRALLDTRRPSVRRRSQLDPCSGEFGADNATA